MISLGGHLTGLKLGPQVAENGNDGIGSFISRIDFFFFLKPKEHGGLSWEELSPDDIIGFFS